MDDSMNDSRNFNGQGGDVEGMNENGNENIRNDRTDGAEHRDENFVDFDVIDSYKIDEGFDGDKIEFYAISEGDMMLYHFSTLDVAFEFYNMYAQKKGFVARKWNVVRNKSHDITQQTFVCYKQGFRLEKLLRKGKRKREPRHLTRCGCEAFFRVRYIGSKARWNVKAFSDEHSHELLSEKYMGMLSGHRKMHECDLIQMNSMRDAGIGVTQIDIWVSC
ncbi:FAR1 DNA-binding domain [Sesbania bispinosa]|nr:FAR1 DNA-binding domain [Sesbania bispinosa]